MSVWFDPIGYFLHSPYSCCSTVRTTSLPILALASEKGKFPMATCSCRLWASPPFSATLAASAPNTDHTRPDTASSRPRRHRVNRRVCVMRRNSLNSQQHPHPVAAAHTICRRLVTDLSAAVGFDGCRPNWATLGSQKVHCHTSQFAGRRHPAAGCTATRPTTEPSLAAPLPVVRRRARRVPIRSSRVRRSRRQRVATTEALPRAREACWPAPPDDKTDDAPGRIHWWTATAPSRRPSSCVPVFSRHGRHQTPARNRCRCNGRM